tara:strand:- start:592 stop:2343 length:1752 start_codon:yes stop_codon:yes gene_type:complete
MRIIFDLESNGLLEALDTIHCIAYVDLDTKDKEIQVSTGIESVLELLEDANEIIGHNIVRFDIPAIQKVYPKFNPKGKVTDTLVLSQLIKANLYNDDFSNVTLPPEFLKRMYGSHSLKAWGMRMSNLKDDYSGGWEECNEEMLKYCKQDVGVTQDLYNLLMAENFSEESIELEHSLNEICYRIGNNGWYFDVESASNLYAKLAQRRVTLESELTTLFPNWIVETPFTPKVNNKNLGYVKGELFIKKKEIQFNPNSRKHIYKCLKDKYGWKPKKWTPSGEAKIDESVLITLPYPEAKKLAEMFMLTKRISQLAEGNQAWLKLCGTDNYLKHTLISNGAVSGRCCHRSPNLAQVPSVRAKYGKECRSLFTAPEGYSIVGADLDALELRCLAHWLDDGNEYFRQILEGDIHSFNQKSAGLETRDQAKTFIYSLIFGGGDLLIGKIVGGNSKDGKKLKAEFDRAVPAFKSLKRELARAYKAKGYIKGLDGRKLYVRSEHKLLSQLLQSTGAIISKKWVQKVDQLITKEKLDARICGFIHDEIQIRTLNKEAEYVGDISRRMAKEAGNYWEMQISAGSTIGSSWADTH